MSGLYGKYKVERTDGKPLEHPVFVLSPETDEAALLALEEYAVHCENNQLSWDLDQWCRSIRRRQSAERPRSIRMLESVNEKLSGL